jgi:hypothetical protein
MREPVAVGVKVAVIVQVALTATELPQVFVCAKSPLIAMAEIVRVAVPVLERVTVWGALVVPRLSLPNVRLLRETEATGAVPVPLRLTDCGLSGALSVIVMAAVRAPTAAGEKVTLKLQLAPAATGALLQLFV